MIVATAIVAASCGQKQEVPADGVMAKQEVKKVHEYIDSGKWGQATAKNVQTGKFDAFCAEGMIEVVFKQADTYAVKTVGHEEALKLYEVKVKEEDGLKRLTARMKDGALERYDYIPMITLLLAAPTLKEVVVDSGDVELKSTLIQSEDLKLHLKSIGSLYVKDIDVGGLKVVVDGEGDVTLKRAKCDGDASVVLNGSGDIEGKLKCKNAKMTVNDDGEIDLNIKCKELTAECNGRGDISLKGECLVLKKKESAFGSIDSRKMAAESVILSKK